VFYSHEIDFQRDIHPGDRFEILYDSDDEIRQGRRRRLDHLRHHVCRPQSEACLSRNFSDSTVDYFDETGKSVRRTLLRTPVAAAHITSGFGMRVHPILGYSKNAKGVDFGASTGTPIFAAGTAWFEEVGFKGGYGRYIKLRHNGQLETAYAHMSRFAPSLYRGSHVNQGQVIATSVCRSCHRPHLHFETIVNNQQV